MHTWDMAVMATVVYVHCGYVCVGANWLNIIQYNNACYVSYLMFKVSSQL